MTGNNQRTAARLFPVFDRGDLPLVEVSDLKHEIEEMVASGEDIPYVAFVSGPDMNLQVEFTDFDADRHKPIVAAGLMGLIRRGANRIVIASEVWFQDNDDGTMILEATGDGDIFHTAHHEGKYSLGDWSSAAGSESGNLANLFARASEGALVIAKESDS